VLVAGKRVSIALDQQGRAQASADELERLAQDFRGR